MPWLLSVAATHPLFCFDVLFVRTQIILCAFHPVGVLDLIDQSRRYRHCHHYQQHTANQPFDQGTVGGQFTWSAADELGVQRSSTSSSQQFKRYQFINHATNHITYPRGRSVSIRRCLRSGSDDQWPQSIPVWRVGSGDGCELGQVG